MTAENIVEQALAWFDQGEYKRTLARRVAIATESQSNQRDAELARYLDEEIKPALSAMGFSLLSVENPHTAHRPFLIATRIEDSNLPTVLSYGHGDVVFGDDENWRQDLSPWELKEEGDRWYGRGSADNKGQHSVNIAALEQISKPAAAAWDSTANCCLKWAKKSALRDWLNFAVIIVNN